MSLPDQLLSFLNRPGDIVFAENQAALQRLRKDDLVPLRIANGTLWAPPDRSSGLKVMVTPAGHAILYGEHGYRILYLDPGGTPLHECAWDSHPAFAGLVRARVRLDWGQWVGIKPQGLINAAAFDLSAKPGWQRLTREDLQAMAARAMGTSADEVALFYDDDSLKLDEHGQITIRHRKDALYVLKDGDFDHPCFMACMGAMHWGRIDFLPVVELFQSLLAGTGSAVFELIRGLYDDQNTGDSPRVLRYRGIPTYPSAQAYRLFSTYFVPEVEEKDASWRVRGGRVKIAGVDPFSVFMDPARSAEVAWRPRSNPPHRFVDQDYGLCVTVGARLVQKVTKASDPTALPFTRPSTNSLASEHRFVGVTKSALLLRNGASEEEFPIKQEWGILRESPLPITIAHPPTWRDLFPEGAPDVHVVQAYFAVPLYPDDEAIVEELATQPLAIEQILIYLERHRLTRPKPSVLIDQWDAVSAECIEVSGAQSGTILYDRAEFAQRQAQRVAAQSHGARNHTPLAFSFLPITHRPQAYTKTYDLVLRWISFDQYSDGPAVEQAVEDVAAALGSPGFAIVAGPPGLRKFAMSTGLFIEAEILLTETPGVDLLRGILPRARIRPDLFIYLFSKTRP